MVEEFLIHSFSVKHESPREVSEGRCRLSVRKVTTSVRAALLSSKRNGKRSSRVKWKLCMGK